MGDNKGKIQSKVDYYISVLFIRATRFFANRISPFTKKKTLLFLKVDSIGDYILVRNFIECIKESTKYKDYSLTFCGNSWWKDLAENLDSDYVSNFIWIDYDRMQKESFYRFKKYFKIFTSGFETLIHPTYSRDLIGDNLVKHSGAFHRMGFKGDNTNLPEEIKKDYDNSYSFLVKTKLDVEFEFERNKYFFQEVLGSPVDIKRPALPAYNSFEEYIVICPGAKKSFRRWNPNNFAKLCDLLGEKYKGEFLICGSKSDSGLADEIIKFSKQTFIDYTGKINLFELVNILKKAKLIITNDSGPLHIAYAMNKKVVGISSGYHHGRFSPYPSEMNLKGICIFPKELQEILNKSNPSRELINEDYALDINSIMPEDVYRIIVQTYLE